MKTHRIIELYNDRERRMLEMTRHAEKLEAALQEAIRELNRVNNTEDGMPLISHIFMAHLNRALE